MVSTAIKPGKWIKLIRNVFLGMNQPNFAKWLTETTGEPVNAKLVARMENCGEVDTSKQSQPSEEIIDALESVSHLKLGERMPVIISSDILDDSRITTQALTVKKDQGTQIDKATISSIGRSKEKSVSPIYYYSPAVYRPELSSNSFRYSTSSSSHSSSTLNFTIRVLSKRNNTNLPIQNAHVIAFTNFDEKLGDEGVTNDHGEVELSVDNATNLGNIECIFVHAPLSGHWGYYASTIDSNPFEITLREVSIPHNTGILCHFYPNLSSSIGENPVKVGVIDAGINLERNDLNVGGGCAFFQDPETGEDAPPAIYSDNGSGHGTHVSGIIGSFNQNCLGMAPGVELYSYRVFENAEHWEKVYTNTFNLVNAIRQAIDDKCDIINLSLGYNPPKYSNLRDRKIEKICKEAFNNGILLVAAAGNNGINRVNLPARLNSVHSVSAMGRESTCPSDTDACQHLGSPLGNDPLNKFAIFSNYDNKENDIQFIEPGIGVISTVNSDGFGVMSGTSMACPVVSGIAANLLSNNSEIFNMPRNHLRTEAMIKLVGNNLDDLGFGRAYQGNGMPQF